MSASPHPLHVSIVTLPESSGIAIQGMYEALSIVGTLMGDTGAAVPPFHVETVGPVTGIHRNAFGLPVEAQRSISETQQTDIIIIGSVIPAGGKWVTGRYPETIEWLTSMYAAGACLASACTGAFVLAETRLLDGYEATTHWAFAPEFRHRFPGVRLRIEELLLSVRNDPPLLTAGSSGAWEDLVLHLIARYVGPESAAATGRLVLYHSMRDSQAPYISFPAVDNHDDDAVRDVESWIRDNYASLASVEALVQRSGLSPRSFQRRFKRATGYSPVHYVQNTRVEQAKRLLESSDIAVDDVARMVGYQEPAAFRRVFKRTTRMTPAGYRQRFRLPVPAVAAP